MPHRFGSLAAAAMAAALVAALGAPWVVLAHAELESSTPADGATLTEAPTEIRLVFDGELIPNGTSLTVTDASGSVVAEGELDLDVAERNEVAAALQVTRSGTYSVAWSAASLDGHVEEGVLAFTIEPAAEAEPPDTAIEADDGRALLILGLALIAITLALVRRRRLAGAARD